MNIPNLATELDDAQIFRLIYKAKEVGRIRFKKYPEYIWISYISVKAKYRGRGFAKFMYAEFRKYIMSHYRKIEWVMGDIGSKGVLRLRNSVFGKPHTVKGKISKLNELSVQKRYLRVEMPTSVRVWHKIR